MHLILWNFNIMCSGYDKVNFLRSICNLKRLGISCQCPSCLITTCDDDAMPDPKMSRWWGVSLIDYLGVSCHGQPPG